MHAHLKLKIHICESTIDKSNWNYFVPMSSRLYTSSTTYHTTKQYNITQNSMSQLHFTIPTILFKTHQ